MTLAELGNLGEAISGIAVLVTLVYLAYQTRQNSKMLKQSLDAQTALMASENTDQGLQIIRDQMTNPGLARIVEKLRNAESIDVNDVPVAHAYMDAWFLRMENLITQAHLSGFDKKVVDHVVTSQINLYKQHAIFSNWWESRRSGHYGIAFSKKVDSLVMEHRT